MKSGTFGKRLVKLNVEGLGLSWGQVSNETKKNLSLGKREIVLGRLKNLVVHFDSVDLGRGGKVETKIIFVVALRPGLFGAGVGKLRAKDCLKLPGSKV